MTPAQPEPGHATGPRTRTRIRNRRHGRAAESEGAPLSHLRRRCTGGAIAASCGYLSVLTTTAARATALNDPVSIGLLVGFGTTAGLCAIGAILAWAVEQMPQPSFDQQAETVEWAIRLGEDMADAYRRVPAGHSDGR